MCAVRDTTIRLASVGSLLRRAFAAASIAALAGLGMFDAWRNGRHNWILTVVGTLGPATAYAFGYFRNMPDILGSRVVTHRGTLWQRWSDFARLSASIAIVITWIAYGIAFPSLSLSNKIKVVVSVFVSSLLLAACVVASEEYLARSMKRGEANQSTGWRAWVRRVIGKSGMILIEQLRAKRALFVGSALVLASLGLRVQSYFLFGENSTGYDVVSGRGVWLNVNESAKGFTVQFIVAQVDRLAYVLGLAVAVFALVSLVSGRIGNPIRKSEIFGILSGMLALFVITNSTTPTVDMFDWSSTLVDGLSLVLWALLWVVPISFWLWRAQGGGEKWEHTRIAVMVFYLPLLFILFGFLPFVVLPLLTDGALGYGSFLVGILLVWWGFVQSQ